MTLHPYWDDLEDTLVEDEEIQTLDFLHSYPTQLCDAPTLAMVRQPDDIEEAYRFLKMFMQHQQWKLPRRRWVMKGIEHQRHLSALFRAFPDAVCLFPHREPAEFLPSNLAIAAVVYDGITQGAIDRTELAAGYLQDFEQRISAVMTDPAMDDPRVRHVDFREFIADPIAGLKECYQQWGFDWSCDGEATMRAWLADPANDSDRYGRQKYTFEPFGVEWDQISRNFDGYRAKYLQR